MNSLVKNIITESINLLSADDEIQFGQSDNMLDRATNRSEAEYIQEQTDLLKDIMIKQSFAKNHDFLLSIIQLGERSKIRWKLEVDGIWYLTERIHNLIKEFGPDINLNWMDVSRVKSLDWFFVANENKPKQYDTWGKTVPHDDYTDISNFSGDISKWDVSNVKSMLYMFYKNDTFKSDISNWNTQSLENTEGMFKKSKVSVDLSKWDVSHVKNMREMFYEFSGKSLCDFSKWNTINVRTMESMFEGCLPLFDNGIGNWEVGHVKNMKNLFHECAMLQADLSRWNVKHARDMSGMFAYTSYFDCNINDWNVSRAENMEKMFYQANAFNSPLNKWDVSNVEHTDSMFDFARSFNQDISNWDLWSLETSKDMFYRKFPDEYKPSNLKI